MVFKEEMALAKADMEESLAVSDHPRPDNGVELRLRAKHSASCTPNDFQRYSKLVYPRMQN
jgi:hypothetical protein